MKVVIIDDEQVSLFLIQQRLIHDGVATEKNVLSFQSAKEALTSLVQHDKDFPDIILLDLNMPEMDGWKFLKELAAYEPKITGQCRIFILTTSLDVLDEDRAKGHSMVAGFFHKPLSSEDIKKIVSTKP
ncbi:response regulator [Nafulsella turpanensis]|uniref:response regulator n=1 Tax=Nafulsella turpanensis TaxID=1265690 RepID=UPI00035E8EDA|nr:response regulator [Nafulsella turpanensis]